MFLGLKRRDSVTLFLLHLGLPSYDTLLYNTRVFFCAWSNCPCSYACSHVQQLVHYIFF